MSKAKSGVPSDRLKPVERLKVVETYLRALEKLAAIVPEVKSLEAEVAEREVEVLKQVLGLMSPVLERIAQPVVLREPWLDGADPSERRTLREPGLLLTRSFHQHKDGQGAQIHRSRGLVLLTRGRLLELDELARWVEPGRRDASWRVETAEVEITPAFARENLPAILTAILDALRDALSREVDNKRELKDRLLRLSEAERALG